MIPEGQIGRTGRWEGVSLRCSESLVVDCVKNIVIR